MPMNLRKITIKDIALLLNTTEDDLAQLAEKAPHMYYTRRQQKPNGEYRIIEAPHDSLKKVQKILLNKLLSKIYFDPILFGGKGSSTKKTVRCHTRKSLVMTMDIKDFFPNVKSHIVRNMFVNRRAKRDVAVLLTRLVTRKNHLPQGAPTSPCIARLILHPVAKHLKGAMKSINGWVNISIWVDDATFSGSTGIKRLKKTLISIFERHGFEIPSNKISVMPNNQEQVSLGIRLNKGIGVPSSYLKKYEEECKRLGKSSPRCKGMRAYIRSLKS